MYLKIHVRDYKYNEEKSGQIRRQAIPELVVYAILHKMLGNAFLIRYLHEDMKEVGEEPCGYLSENHPCRRNIKEQVWYNRTV